MAISPTTGPLSSPGIASGLDVNSIITKLMAIEQQPLTTLAQSEASLQAKISAYGTLKGSLSALQATLAGLKNAQSLTGLSATVADSSVATATTGSGAVAGSYAVEVTQLAQSHKIASAGFANTTDVVGSGTLTFAFGTYDGVTFALNGTSPSRTVTIGAGQSTLAGIRDAVNNANIGVTATIVNDGSAAGNRLVFTSSLSGAANSLKVTVSDNDSNNVDNTGLSQLAYDPTGTLGNGRNLTQKVVAQNALLAIDGINVSKASNVVTDAIQGVTLNLLSTNSGDPTRLNVANDSSSITSSVQAFVKSYNDLTASITSLTKYDPDTRTASTLTGDSAARSIQNGLRTILGGALAGVGSVNTLQQAGISFSTDGTLALDTTRLSAQVAANPIAVARLFAAVGTTTDSLIGVNATGSKVQPGTYAVTVAQLATQGTAVGAGAAGLTITAGVNDSLNVTVDGTSATVTLAAGTYASASALAAEIQAKINGDATLTQKSASVKVTASGGTLTVASSTYGSTSTLAVGGAAAANLFGGAPTIAAGVDVAGTIGGATATGNGRVLSGAVGSTAEGVQLQINGGATGARGDFVYTQGFANQLDQALTDILDSTNGILATRTDGANKSIADIDNRRDALNLRLQQVEANYRKQFQALDTLLSSMQSTSTFLTQQLANLPKISGA